MRLEKRTSTGREKEEASVQLLRQLRKKLYSDNISAARRAAFSLSWMQEDGLDILNEALFGNSSKKTKTAAGYGLRSMRGRMKKMAINAFEQGLKHANRDVREVCTRSLSLTGQKPQGKPLSPEPAGAAKFTITDIPSRSRQKTRIKKNRRQEQLLAAGGRSRR